MIDLDPEALNLFEVVSLLKIMSVASFNDLDDALSVGLQEFLVGLIVHDVWQGYGAEA